MRSLRDVALLADLVWQEVVRWAEQVWRLVPQGEPALWQDVALPAEPIRRQGPQQEAVLWEPVRQEALLLVLLELDPERCVLESPRKRMRIQKEREE